MIKLKNPKSKKPSPSALAIWSAGYKLVGHDGIGLKNSESVIVEHVICSTIRTSKTTAQKAAQKSWEICPTCHDVKQRSKTRTREQLIKSLDKMSLRAIGTLGAELLIHDRIKVSCIRVREGEVCGHERCLCVRDIAGRGLSCPLCVGNKLTGEVVSARANILGLTVMNPEDYGNLNSPLNFRCANAHVFQNTWGNQRQRGCPKCSRSTGERLVDAWCRALWREEEWLPEHSVGGLDPDNLSRAPHRYDLASPTLKVLIENHSDLHDDPKHHFFREGRPRDDFLKEQAVADGGPLDGWRLVIVRWSEENLGSILADGAGGISSLMKDFEIALSKQMHSSTTAPLTLPEGDQPTTSQLENAHAEHNRHESACLKIGLKFMEGQFWAGFGANYNYRCGGCAYENRMQARSALNRERPCQSCGSWQTWAGFVHACQRAGFEVTKYDEPRTTKEQVILRCLKHGVELKAMRSTISKKLRENPDSLCTFCMPPVPKADVRKTDGSKTWPPFCRAMEINGWFVPDQEWKGTSKRDEKVEQYEAHCMTCHNMKMVGIHQAMQKFKNLKGLHCTYCEGQKKLHAFINEAARWGLSYPLDAQLPTAKDPVNLLCSRPDCPHGGTRRISPDNLRRRGPSCKKCGPT